MWVTPLRRHTSRRTLRKIDRLQVVVLFHILLVVSFVLVPLYKVLHFLMRVLPRQVLASCIMDRRDIYSFSLAGRIFLVVKGAGGAHIRMVDCVCVFLLPGLA